MRIRFTNRSRLATYRACLLIAQDSSRWIAELGRTPSWPMPRVCTLHRLTSETCCASSPSPGPGPKSMREHTKSPSAARTQAGKRIAPCAKTSGSNTPRSTWEPYVVPGCCQPNLFPLISHDAPRLQLHADPSVERRANSMLGQYNARDFRCPR